MVDVANWCRATQKPTTSTLPPQQHTRVQAAADFNFIQCTARDTVVFQVRGDGYIEIAELVITAG